MNEDNDEDSDDDNDEEDPEDDDVEEGEKDAEDPNLENNVAIFKFDDIDYPYKKNKKQKIN